MAEPQTKKPAAKDLMAEEGFLTNFVGQLAGNATNVLIRRGHAIGPVQGIVKLIVDKLGTGWTIQTMNGAAALLQTVLPALGQIPGVPPAIPVVLREVTDEAFDAIREEVAKGRFSQSEANAVMAKAMINLEQRLDSKMSFEWALQFLQAHEQIQIREGLEVLCANPDNARAWEALWRSKLNKPGLIYPLLQIPHEHWAKHLGRVLGDVPGNKKPGSIAGVSPTALLGALTGENRNQSVINMAQKTTRELRRGTADAKASADALAALRGKR